MDQVNVDLQIHDQNEQLKYITRMELNTIKEDIYMSKQVTTVVQALVYDSRLVICVNFTTGT